jgi:hypothetical protein
MWLADSIKLAFNRRLCASFAKPLSNRYSPFIFSPDNIYCNLASVNSGGKLSILNLTTRPLSISSFSLAIPTTMAVIHGESSFAYHGLPTKPMTQEKVQNQSSEMAQSDQVKSLIKAFLEDIKFDRTSPFIKDHKLEAAVWEYFKNLNLGEKTEKSVQRTLKLSVTLTHQAYTALPFEIRALCAIQFLYMFLVDDVAEEFMEDLQSFGQK